MAEEVRVWVWALVWADVSPRGSRAARSRWVPAALCLQQPYPADAWGGHRAESRPRSPSLLRNCSVCAAHHSR